MNQKALLTLFTMVSALGVAFGVGALTGSSTAETPPRVFPYQGYLEDSSGTPINGTRAITFFITRALDTPVAPDTDCQAANACRWKETQDVALSNGYFSVNLPEDENTNVFGDGFFDESELYLRLVVADDGGANPVVLDGAQRLLATPYAITAQVATNFSVDQLTVAQGATIGSTLRVTGGDVLATGGGLEVGNHPATSNPDTGDLYVADDIDANGDADVGGNLHAGGNITLNGSLEIGPAAGTPGAGDLFVDGDIQADGSIRLHAGSPFSPFTAAAGTSTTLTSWIGHLCFISGISVIDNTTGGDQTRSCTIRPSGGNYVLTAGSRSTCEALCTR